MLKHKGFDRQNINIAKNKCVFFHLNSNYSQNMDESCFYSCFNQSQFTNVDRISLSPCRHLLFGLIEDRFTNLCDCPCKLFIICTACLIVVVRIIQHIMLTLPLNKDSSLNSMDNATKTRFFFISPQHQAHLPGKGGGQPVSHL